jgi:phosphoribosylglycinamide formyltransferase-1
MARLKLGVLISGRGSNLQALIDATADPSFPAKIAVVISNRPGIAGLDRAKAAGLATTVVDHKAYPDRPTFEQALIENLDQAGVECVCLAGFMRLLTPTFVNHWAGRAINIHPSLLPAFSGLHTHQRAIDAGVRFAGATVHFLSAEMDGGPIIIQTATPILPNDDAGSLATRVLNGEHEIYVRAVRWFAEGKIRIEDGRAVIHDIDDAASFYLPSINAGV